MTAVCRWAVLWEDAEEKEGGVEGEDEKGTRDERREEEENVGECV